MHQESRRAVTWCEPSNPSCYKAAYCVGEESGWHSEQGVDETQGAISIGGADKGVNWFRHTVLVGPLCSAKRMGVSHSHSEHHAQPCPERVLH